MTRRPIILTDDLDNKFVVDANTIYMVRPALHQTEENGPMVPKPGMTVVFMDGGQHLFVKGELSAVLNQVFPDVA